MPNSFKFNSSTTESLSLRKYNIYIGVGDVGKGPTSLTGFKGSPSFGTASSLIGLHRGEGVFSWYRNFSDSELISRTNRIDTSIVRTTKEECFSYFAEQSDKIVLNRQYESIVTNGLVLNLDAGFLPSYPTTGDAWYDLSLNPTEGGLVNTPTFDSGNGGSIVFDGSNDYVFVNLSSDILSNTTYTKTAWFYVTSFLNNNNNIISGGNAAQHAFWLAGTDKLRAGHNGLWSTVVSTTTLALNTWYFGAVSFSTTDGWKLYVNGIQESTSANTTTFSGNGGVLIGAYNLGQNVFNGRISLAQIYNRVLSASEILQNYNATKDRYITTTTTTSTTTIGEVGQPPGG
jgi:hypothetical protein